MVLGQDWDSITELRSRERHLTESDALRILGLESYVGYYGEEYTSRHRGWFLASWEPK